MNAVFKLVGDVDTINHLPLDSIQTDPNQPRKHFDVGSLQTLADDIKARGVIQPITVRLDENKQVTIVYGERRFKAAQLAGLETIPAIGDYREREPVDRLIDQVAENLQRDDLKPMEMAAFFDALYSDHDIKMKDIPGILEERGLKKMERSYVTNMRRLLKLPNWAKEMIDAGTLTASHGKHILQAEGHDNVLTEIRTYIERETDNYCNPPTVSRVHNRVQRAFAQHYRDITLKWDSYRPEGTKFDIKTCANCKTCKSFKTDWGRVDTYCFDEACWQKKQDVAFDKEKMKLEKAEAKVQAEASEQGNEQPEIMTEGQKSLQSGRIERTQLYLDEWLRTQLREYLPDAEAVNYAILLWAGTGAPGNITANGYYTEDKRLATPNCTGKQKSGGIDVTLKADLTTQENLLAEVVAAALDSMSRSNLRRLAHHCEITLDAYCIDRDYLSIKTKAELIDSAPEAVRDSFDDWSKTIKRPAGELIESILNRDQHFGVPTDLIEFYNPSQKAKS